jgi:glycosyltransferase involved in cell wall biosynthesis
VAEAALARRPVPAATPVRAPAPPPAAAPVRLLTVASLYPNAAMPTFGVFVENRLRRLVAGGAVTSRVVAPVPWFFSRHPRFGAWARWAQVPAAETRHGIAVTHPRYVTLPKVGTAVQPRLLHMALRRHVAALAAAGHRFDVVDAQYYYPDGVAAAWLARELGLPLVITARGTDLNHLPGLAVPRRLIAWAAREAAASICVAGALADVLHGLGAPRERVHVLRNGVDLALFSPGDRAAERARQGLTGPVVLSVGQLVERKGHHLALAAVAGLPGVTLVIAGGGPERARLLADARRLGITGRVRLLGEVAHEALPALYRAADVLVLASSREGWANVLLEAMACGTPVVATAIWGTPEVVAAPAAGRLVPERTAAALAAGLVALLAAPPARAATRAYAEAFSWDATIQAQAALYRAVAAERRAAA